MKIKDWLFVGYYTPDKNYPMLAYRMQQSVLRQGFDCIIEERPSAICNRPPPMPWVLNCAKCAEFCLDMFENYPGKNIFYLDADADMIRFPELLISPDLPKFDLAAPIVPKTTGVRELISNSLIFRRTKGARKILKAWKKEQERRVKYMLAGYYSEPFGAAWDQKVLQNVLEEKPEISFFPLPWEYAKIAPKMGREIMVGVDPEKVVIAQRQVSRKNRRYVGTPYDYPV